MKKILLFGLFLFFVQAGYSFEIYDAEWCRKNGGEIEFDFEFNINFNCITNSFYKTPYLKKLYNIVIKPYSSILKNEEPMFLKLIGEVEIQNKSIFDEYNWKITEDELVRYI